MISCSLCIYLSNHACLSMLVLLFSYSRFQDEKSIRYNIHLFQLQVLQWSFLFGLGKSFTNCVFAFSPGGHLASAAYHDRESTANTST